jgi:hypothetical protein
VTRRLESDHYNSVTGLNYRTYADGTVVAYAPERGSGGTRWLASAWSAHPLLSRSRARHAAHLCADATWSELWTALRAYEAGPGGDGV